jgi:hypothetical protein
MAAGLHHGCVRRGWFWWLGFPFLNSLMEVGFVILGSFASNSPCPLHKGGLVWRAQKTYGYPMRSHDLTSGRYTCKGPFVLVAISSYKLRLRGFLACWICMDEG